MAKASKVSQVEEKGIYVNMRLVLVVLMLLSGCVTQPIIQESPKKDVPQIVIYENKLRGESSIMMQEALASYRASYIEASIHKAFAQSVSGAWSWKSGRTSREHAITNALVSCQSNNRENEKIYPCKTINIDGEWVEK